MRRAAFTLALALVLSASATAAAAVETIELTTADGTRLAAAWHAPAQAAPAVLLVHMLTRSHHEWDQAAQALNQAGFGVLAIDLRGHGASSGSWAGGLGALQQDVAAALVWLKARLEVMPDRLGIAGASLGASLALLGAAGDPAVRSLALLSPAADYRGLRVEPAMRRFAERSGAALLVAATGDPYALRTARQFQSIGPGLRELAVVEGHAHGTTLLLARPDLVASLVDWFRRSLL